VVGLQEQYRTGLAALGPDFADLDPADAGRSPRRGTEAFRALLFAHACEALYGDPVYGGNRGGAAWQAIGFAGDVQPRGGPTSRSSTHDWTVAAVTEFDCDR